MVKIVTGAINSLKTTRMVELYEKNHSGDGFVSIKNMQNEKVHSYTIKRLSSGEKRLFIIRDEFNQSKEPIALQIGPYQILQNTLVHIEEEIRKMISDKVSPIYLDEIGLLELEGKMFSDILREILSSKADVYLCIRRNLIDEIVEKYQIKDYVIVSE